MRPSHRIQSGWEEDSGREAKWVKDHVLLEEGWGNRDGCRGQCSRRWDWCSCNRQHFYFGVVEELGSSGWNIWTKGSTGMSAILSRKEENSDVRITVWPECIRSYIYIYIWNIIATACCYGNTNWCFYSMVMSLWTTINMWSRWWVTLQELWLIWSLETICDLLSENPAHPAYWKNQVKATNHNSYLRSFHKRISKRLVVQLLRYSWKHTPHTRNYFLCKSILLRSSVLHVLYLNMFSTYIALAVQ